MYGVSRTASYHFTGWIAFGSRASELWMECNTKIYTYSNNYLLCSKSYNSGDLFTITNDEPEIDANNETDIQDVTVEGSNEIDTPVVGFA